MRWKMPKNPFVGLRPFEAEDSLLFFGRHEQILDLMHQLHDSRFLAVVGSSGSGKSSLIRAGLIPRLQGGFMVEDRDIWHVVKMKPGDQPLHNLAGAILVALNKDVTHLEDFVTCIREEGVQAILDKIQPLLNNGSSNMLLLVDQFEEIFRFEKNRSDEQSDDVADFVAMMLSLSRQNDLPIYVTMTMRSDFLGDCDAFYGLPEAMNQSQYLVPRLTRQQRREAIEGPIQLYGASINSRLTDRLLNETIEARDDLPVLQHALMRTWEAAQKEGTTEIDIHHYDSIGTIKKALLNHAEEALEGMGDKEMLLTKRLFQALTEIDSGNRSIRRPTKLNTVTSRTGAKPEEIWDIIQKFRSDGRSFLIPSSENPDENPLIDISHESLIRQWDRLNEWVGEEAESAKTYNRLAETAKLHKEGKAGYYRNPDLQIALDWYARETPNVDWASGYHPGYDSAVSFLKESEVEYQNDLHEKEEKRRQELQKERKNRRTLFFAIIGVLLAVIALSGYYLTMQKNQKINTINEQLEKKNIELGLAKDELNLSVDSLTVKKKLTDSLVIVLNDYLIEAQDQNLKLRLAQNLTLKEKAKVDSLNSKLKESIYKTDSLLTQSEELTETLSKTNKELENAVAEANSLRQRAEKSDSLTRLENIRNQATRIATISALESNKGQRSYKALQSYFLNNKYNQREWNSAVVEALWGALGEENSTRIRHEESDILDLISFGNRIVYLTAKGKLFFLEDYKFSRFQSLDKDFFYKKNTLSYNKENDVLECASLDGRLYRINASTFENGTISKYLSIPKDTYKSGLIEIREKGVWLEGSQILNYRTPQEVPVVTAYDETTDHLAIGMQNGWMYLLNLHLKPGQMLIYDRQHHEFGSRISDIEFGQNGKYIATTGLDGYIQIALVNDLHRNGQFAKIAHGYWANCIQIRENEIIIGTQDGYVNAYKFDPELLADKVCQTTTFQKFIKGTPNLDSLSIAINKMIDFSCK